MTRPLSRDNRSQSQILDSGEGVACENSWLRLVRRAGLETSGWLVDGENNNNKLGTMRGPGTLIWAAFLIQKVSETETRSLRGCVLHSGSTHMADGNRKFPTALPTAASSDAMTVSLRRFSEALWKHSRYSRYHIRLAIDRHR